MLNFPVSTRSVIEALESRIAPAAFTVTTTADSGPGSLRQAILDANALEGADTIGISIAGGGTPIIALLSPLPAITDKVALDAAILLDGSNAGENAHGLVLSGTTGSVISRLRIAHFSGDGIRIEGSINAQIVDSQVFSNGGNGIHILGGSKNWINRNQINENGLYGVAVMGGAGSSEIHQNVLSANGVRHGETEQGGGIAVIDSPSNRIGGTWGDRGAYGPPILTNTITDSSGVGILITGSLSSSNLIGYNLVKDTKGDGIRIENAPLTRIGGTFTWTGGRADVTYLQSSKVTGSQGWSLALVGATGGLIEGTTLEEGVLGGMLIENSQSVNVGSTTVYGGGISANTITGSAATGITVRNSTGITLTNNVISGDTVTPIDLGGDGPTPNDVSDSDTGANRLQNFSDIVASVGRVSGTLSTDAPLTDFRIEIYELNPWTSLYTPIARRIITTDLGGNISWQIDSQFFYRPEQVFATATNLSTGDTSEFSPAAIVWPRVSVGPTSVIEGNSGAQDALFTVSLDRAVTVPVKVGYHSANNTAKAGEDYAAVEGFLVFEPGETTKTISVPIFGDPIEEATESFYVNLTSVENGYFSTANATGTILNDDALSVISVSDSLIVEGSTSSAILTVTLSKPSLDPVTVQLKSIGGTATASSDYGVVDKLLTFAPGATSATVSIPVWNDSIREETETIQLQLSNPSGGILGKAEGIVTIIDDDTWEIRADALEVLEGADGQSLATMRVRLVNPYGVTDHEHSISVNFATQGGTAAAGVDYLTTQGGVTFEPGEFEKTITIPILGDLISEQHERFSVLFSAPIGAKLGQNSQTVTILNDDPATVSVAPASITEGHSGQKTMLFQVTLSAPPTSPVTVGYLTQEGSATAGVDFASVSGEVSFAVGETQKTVSVLVYGDRIVEGNETLSLVLTNALGANLGTSTAAGTILDDEPTISIEDMQVPEGSAATSRTVYLPVRLSYAADIPISVDFDTSNGTAEASSDYVDTAGTLVFAPGQTLQFIELQIVGDLDFEPDETFLVKLSNLQGAVMGQAAGVVTIKADEVFLSAQNVTLTEGNSGTKSLIFTVTLSQVQAATVIVDYATADGTATSGSDYTAVAGTLTFAPGETTKTISVPILGDILNEADETFRLLLSNAIGAAVATAEIQGVIANDDSPQSLPVISVSNGSLIEGDSGTSAMVFTFSLSKASTITLSLLYSTEDGTATAGSDYTGVSGTLTFAPGETSKTVSVPVFGDILNEADEIFHLQLLKAVGGADLVNTRPTGTIISDDFPPSAVGLVVSDNGRKALWTDGDGDIVTLTSSKSLLSSHNFQFGLDTDGLLSLQKLVLDAPSGIPVTTSLKFSVVQSGTGDGLVNVEAIHTSGDLNKLSLPGRLSSLAAGDSKLKTPAVHKLMVNSFGLDPVAAEAGAAPLVSSITGNVGHFVVKNDFLGAHLSVLSGGIKSLAVGGDIRGTDPLHPVEIQMAGAFHRIDVGGDVIHADLIAGAVSGLKGVQAGKAVVQGDWTASNLTVGAGAGLDGFFGTEDDIVLQGTPSRIARITIGGTISGTAEVENHTDHFGFVAGRIAAFQVGGSKMPLSSKWNDSSEIGSNSDVILRELAGRIRA